MKNLFIIGNGFDIAHNFSSDALFINFNYTETLESIYGISRHQICYIHGRIQVKLKGLTPCQARNQSLYSF